MQHPKVLSAAACIAAGFAFHGAASAQSLPSTDVAAVPTYESAGLYWQSPGGTSGCEVRYRRSGDASWSQGLAMWYDSRDGQCRGSLVHLQAGTTYEAELGLPGQAASRGITFRTWPNQRPVAKTITVNSGSGTFNISEGGSPTGYVVYQGAPGAVLDGQNSAQYNITVNASYVIVRGLALKGAKQDAIRISPSVKDVIIEDNEISGWGRTRDGKWGTDQDSAVRAVCSSPTLERVTIQRNRIHSPRYSANSWSDGHPAGPQAISFDNCGGNHVFRHNEVWSGNGNYYNDIIGGADNFTKTGFPNADSDIYGNRLSHAWDDGIEAEGANENVRIWGNYIDRTAIGIATTATSIGPVYMFRNVWNRAQMYERVASLDADDRQPFFKSGGTDTLGHGRRYIFHNTMLQARQSGLAYGLGGGFATGGTGSTQLIQNTLSKNNIYHVWKDGKGISYQTGSTSQYQNDLYNGTPGDASMTGGIVGTPQYLSGHGWQSEAGGNYQLSSASPGYGRGVRIANFNDGAASPDVGAHQSGTPAMAFGVAGSAGSSVSGGTTTPPPDPEPSPTPASYTLGVSKSGSGSGTVSSPSGISCGSTCSVTLPSGTAVTLSASAASGSSFGGWSGGGCSGTGSCTTTLGSSLTVNATFNASSSGDTGGGTGSGGVTMSATSLNFSGSAPSSQSVTYTNRTSAKVTFIKATMSSAKFGQTNNCGEVAPGASCTATVTYYPGNGGSSSGTLTITSTAPNSPHVLNLSASSGNGSGNNPIHRGGKTLVVWEGKVATAPTTTATPVVAPPPTGVALSAASLGFTGAGQTRTVTYTNYTGQRITFIQASMSSARFGQTNDCGEVAAGASCTARVTYYPSNTGSSTGTLTLTSTAPNSPHVVSLSGS